MTTGLKFSSCNRFIFYLKLCFPENGRIFDTLTASTALCSYKLRLKQISDFLNLSSCNHFFSILMNCLLPKCSTVINIISNKNSKLDLKTTLGTVRGIVLFFYVRKAVEMSHAYDSLLFRNQWNVSHNCILLKKVLSQFV